MTDTTTVASPLPASSNAGVSLDNLSSSKIQFGVSQSQSYSSQPVFGTYDANREGYKKNNFAIQWMTMPGSILLMSIAGLVSMVFLLVTYVISKAANRAEGDEQIVGIYESSVNGIDSLIGYPGIESTQQKIEGGINESTFSTIISSSLPFYFKRKLMEEKVDLLSSKILVDSNKLSAIQKDIAKYGFLHPEIMSMLNTDKEVIPIITSLHTVETVKFGTALKMFSLLDTFLSQSSQLLGISKKELESQMKLYAGRGEKDVARFLSTCYLNPYEILPACDQIDDFSNYFRYDDKGTTIDNKLLSKILVLIDNKLEQSDLPSLQINFDRFAPNSKSLGFHIVVNTLPEDESAFLKKGIINPHIFIISNLVNLLKQSLFVIGNSINVNKLNIQKKNIVVGDLDIPVSTSSMNFNLPLQNSSEREIYDFYDINNDSGSNNTL